MTHPSLSGVQEQYAQTAGQRVLVTGGTGLIGKALCEALVASGYDVLVLTRNLRHAALTFQGRMTLIDSLDYIDAAENIDVIINLAGEPISQRWTTAVKDRLVNSRINTTKQLIDLIARLQTKPSVLISGSAIGVYGTSDTIVFTEDTSPAPTLTDAFAHQLCAEWEQVALTAQTYGVRTCLLRTGVVLSTTGGALGKMLFPFEFCMGGAIGTGKQWFSWIHIDDMIRLIAFVMVHPVSGAVNATAPTPVTNAVFTQALGKVLKRPTVCTMPEFAVKLLFGEMGQSLLLSGQHVVPDKLLKLGFQFHYPEVAQALDDVIRFRK